jgi:hypothetical protein
LFPQTGVCDVSYRASSLTSTRNLLFTCSRMHCFCAMLRLLAPTVILQRTIHRRGRVRHFRNTLYLSGGLVAAPIVLSISFTNITVILNFPIYRYWNKDTKQWVWTLYNTDCPLSQAVPLSREGYRMFIGIIVQGRPVIILPHKEIYELIL